MKYLSYKEYQDLNGKLDEYSFNSEEFKARQKINRYTQNRLAVLKEQPEEVKMCVILLINEFQKHQQSDIANVSADGVSVEYNKVENKEREHIYKKIINDSLSNVFVNDIPVLFRG